MRTGIAVLLSMVTLLGQGSAHAATDWDTKLRAEFQPQKTTTSIGIAARNVETTLQPHRHLTSLLAAARVHWNELSEETRALIRPWMLRPTSSTSGNEEPAWRYPSNLTVSVRSTTHFKIHFLDKATYPTQTNAATLAFVDAAALVLEEVWTVEHGLGYTAVPSDGAAPENGGDGSYDVYLTNIGPSGYYGYVQPEAESNEPARPYGAYSYMVLDNDYTDTVFNDYTDPALPLKVTVAHEYFHAIQLGYSYAEDSAFMEQTATWMEDVVYPAIHDNYQYLGEVYTDSDGNGQYTAGETYFDRNGNGQRDSGSSNYPEAPLDAFDKPARIQYGRFVWIHYLAQNYGAELIKDVWEVGSQSPGNTYATINSVLQMKGASLASAFQDYASWSYDKSAFTDGANYPLVWVDRTQSGNSVSFSSTDSPALRAIAGASPQLHLSTVYSQILNPSGSYSFNSNGGAAALTVLVDNGNGVMQHQVVSLSKGDGSWTAPSGTVKAIAVISNVSTSADSMSWSLASGAAPRKSGGGQLDGWFALLLAASGIIGYRRRMTICKVLALPQTS